jgi:HAD superfamily hydrolase (TIGR01450 family)
MNRVDNISIDSLLASYTVLLIDAYGVLVHTSGALPGAARLIERLNRTPKPYYILTNDASKLPATSAELFQRFGLAIPADRIITSGSLLADYFARHRLEGSSCVVLGPEDSARYVELAGGKVVAAPDPFEVLVIGDESGYPFLETIDTVLSGLFRMVDSGADVHLVLPNPDLIYPKSDENFGIASGSIALILEAALQRRYPHRPELKFARLGKPHSAIFNEALKRSGTMNMVMIGDQLETDIKGALEFGLDAVLVNSGVSNADLNAVDPSLQPTYYLDRLNLSLG